MNLELSQKIDFIKKAAFVAEKSTCLYKIGCVGVVDAPSNFYKTLQKDPNIRIKKGLIYVKAVNETLPGEVYCQTCDKKAEKKCIRRIENLKGRDFQKVCSIHAEVNLIAVCAKHGIATNGMILFVTNSPCYICAKSIIQAGISEIYYISKHTDEMGLSILQKNNINIEVLDFH